MFVKECEEFFKLLMKAFSAGFPSNMLPIVNKDMRRWTLDFENTSRRNCSQSRKQFVHIFAVRVGDSSPEVSEVSSAGEDGVI
jgi:hypothetical protein